MTYTVTQADREAAAARVIRDVCELPDYTSPDDQPDLLQCTVEELELILTRCLTQFEAETLERAAEVAEQHRSAFHEQTNRTANAIAAAIRKGKSDE